MDKRRVIKNYIRETYDCYPGYYVWGKEYFMEYSWIHWACEDILYRLALLPDEDVKTILMSYIDEMEICLKLAKNPSSKTIFQTGLSIAKELEVLV